MGIIKTKTKTKHQENNTCWQRCGEIGALVHCWGQCKMVQFLWKTRWKSLKKLKIELSNDPANPFLGIYSKASKAGS